MPYSSKKTGKNQVTVYKKDSGEVVGHTTPDKYNAYMAALHIHSGDNAAKGGIATPYPEIEQEREEEGTKGSTDEANDPEFEDMPHLADGGFAGDFDVNTGDSDTVKGLPLNAQSLPPPEAEPAPAPETPAPKPAVAMQPSALTQKAVNPRPLPGMPADVTPDELQGYLNQQRATLNKYSPDRQFDTEQAILKSRSGLGSAIARGGATFADAVMQGVAGAGNPGFAKAQAERETELANEATGALERARKGSIEQLEAGQKIDLQDPKSAMSKVYQQAFAPVFSKMGYDPASVLKMPASQINTVADLGVRYADAQTQLEFKKAMLQVQTLTEMANMQNQQVERKQAEDKLAAEHPVQKALGMLGGSGSNPGSPKPLFAKNPNTGHRIMSIDGGKTWKEAK